MWWLPNQEGKKKDSSEGIVNAHNRPDVSLAVHSLGPSCFLNVLHVHFVLGMPSHDTSPIKVPETLELKVRVLAVHVFLL